MQNETEKIISEGKELRALVTSPGWKEAKSRLFGKLVQLDSLNALILEGKSKDDVVREIERRRDLFAFIIEWLKEIEGEGSSSEFVSDITKVREEEIVIQFN